MGRTEDTEGGGPEHAVETPSAEGSRGKLRMFLLLGAPALGLSLAATTLNAYVPVLARKLTSSNLVIGALVSGEGFVALLLPIWIGAASDRVKTRLGPRLPFLLATAPLAAVGLAAAPFAGSIPVLVAAVAVYYVAYFAFYAPYRALESDLVAREDSGRANGIQGAFRAAGMGGGLLGSALLFQIWVPLPFWTAGAVLLVVTAVAAMGLRRRSVRSLPEASAEAAWRRVWALVRDHPNIRRFLVANVLWRFTETGLRAFIVLFLTRGLNESLSFVAVAMGVVGGGALVGAPLAGKLADALGPIRVLRILLLVFGVGLWLGTFVQSKAWILALLPVVGLGGAMALTLPFAILMRIMPRESHGASAGLFDVSGGLGSLLGPLLTGAAIELLRPLFDSTQGYAAMWPVIGTATLLSIFFLERIEAGHES